MLNGGAVGSRSVARRIAPLTAALALVAGVALFVALRDRAAHPPETSLPTIVIGGSPRSEGCLLCHATTRGLGEAHRTIGCSTCHEGDPTARDKEAAHQGMEVVTGALSRVDRTCGQGACHAVEAARVRTSMMARVPGILAVDRFAFGERPTPDSEQDDVLPSLDPDEDPRSPAESHARQLCATCHLGARKELRGDLGFAARGGGCTACHLSAPTLREGPGDGPLHPDVNADVSERRCEGCHGRSGRVSLSYRGLVELEPHDPRVTGTLADGRPMAHASADVHASAGLGCIDCHTERELMGDGQEHRHAEQAIDVACEDCHLATPRTSPPDPDREDVAVRLRASWARRGLPALSSTPIHTRAGTPLVRTDLPSLSLLRASDGERRAIAQAKPVAYHSIHGHERLTCSACHAAWAPRCKSCHTRFDPNGSAIDGLSSQPVRGRWEETAGGNGYGPPLLAVGASGRIEPFIEGMLATIENTQQGTVTRTLYAPLDPHTTGKARGCASCHAPASAEEPYPTTGRTTRTGARLLDANERARVLRVGRCLECHPGYDDAIYVDFPTSHERVRRHAAPRCKGTAGE